MPELSNGDGITLSPDDFLCPICLGSEMEVVPGQGIRRCKCSPKNRAARIHNDVLENLPIAQRLLDENKYLKDEIDIRYTLIAKADAADASNEPIANAALDWSEWMVWLLSPAADREAILGDIREFYPIWLQRFGKIRTNILLVSMIARSVPPFIWFAIKTIIVKKLIGW